MIRYICIKLQYFINNLFLEMDLHSKHKHLIETVQLKNNNNDDKDALLPSLIKHLVT